MTLRGVRNAFEKLERSRRVVAVRQEQLSISASRFVRESPGTLRDKARRMGMSVAYLSDIVNGHRAISRSFMEKLDLL